MHKREKGEVKARCNLRIWGPRFGGFTWGWGPGKEQSIGRGSISYHPSLSTGCRRCEKNHLVAGWSTGRTNYPNHV